MTTWVDYHYGFARHAATKSKDSTQVGAALIGPDGRTVLLTAFNGPPAGVDDAPDRFERPRKYLFASHAEANLVAFAARAGIRTDGCAVVVTHAPCAGTTQAATETCSCPDGDTGNCSARPPSNGPAATATAKPLRLSSRPRETPQPIPLPAPSTRQRWRLASMTTDSKAEELKPGVWYQHGPTVFRLREVEGEGRRHWSAPGVRALENETLCQVSGVDAEAVASQISAALASTARAGAGDWVTAAQPLADIAAQWDDIRSGNPEAADETLVSVSLGELRALNRALSAVPASPRSGAGEKDLSGLLYRLRAAFDSDRIADKNIALRRAHDALSALSQGGGAGGSEKGKGEEDGRVPSGPDYSAQPEPARGLGPAGEYSSRGTLLEEILSPSQRQDLSERLHSAYLAPHGGLHLLNAEVAYLWTKIGGQL